jgi:hypothetical protein
MAKQDCMSWDRARGAVTDDRGERGTAKGECDKDHRQRLWLTRQPDMSEREGKLVRRVVIGRGRSRERKEIVRNDFQQRDKARRE